MVNLFNPQKILIGSPLSKAADILFPVISDSIRQQALPAYSQHISVESTQFSNQGTMAGAALVKDAMYNGSLLIRLLQVNIFNCSTKICAISIWARKA